MPAVDNSEETMSRFDAKHSRRRFVRGASGVAAGALFAPRLAICQGGQDVVETAHGRIRGVTTDGIKCFRGIPYGADTSGRNRFLPPQKPASWSGVRDCTDWGHVAP